MVAFSNAEGGLTFVGVRDDGHVVGETLDQAAASRVRAG